MLAGFALEVPPEAICGPRVPGRRRRSVPTRAGEGGKTR